MASCNSTDILATAYRNGYAKLSSRDLMVAAIASACSTCNAQPLIETAIGLGYLKLSEFDAAMCIAESLCSSPGVTAGPAPTILKLAMQDHLAAMSRRDLDGVIAALLCKMTNPPCVTPATPGTPAAFSTLNNILKISWTQPPNSGSLILNYTVSYGTTQGGPYTSTVTVPAMTKQAILNGLSSGTTYYFVVKANSFTSCSSANSSEGSAATTGAPPISPVVTDWSNRVVANGGAQPSNATILAADAFYKGLQSDGIDGLMIAVNMFAPDSLIAALTPLIKVAGNDPWTNHNFVAGNITTGGLAATGGGLKYLQTGVNLNTALANNNDVGYTMYGMASGTSPQNTMIAQDGGGDLGGIWSMTLIAMYNGWDFNTVVGAAGQYMMVSGNRTAANAEAMYSYNSIQGFVVNGTAVTAPATRPTVELYMGCWNQNGVAGQFNGATQNYSFCAIHHGLTQAQANAFALRIQTLRTAFGGGFS